MYKNYFFDLGEGWVNLLRVDGEVFFVVFGDFILLVEFKCCCLLVLNCNFIKLNWYGVFCRV